MGGVQRNDSNTATCVGCGAPILWVTTVLDKRMPLDPDHHPDGNVIPVQTDAGWRARVLRGEELPAQVPARRSHWVTCTKAPEFRRVRRIPRCRACDEPMDKVWAAQGHDYHVACEPAPRPDFTRPGRRPAVDVVPDVPAGGPDQGTLL